MNTGFLDPAVATVPTACGIETLEPIAQPTRNQKVATVPTACGIETSVLKQRTYTLDCSRCNSAYRLRY